MFIVMFDLKSLHLLWRQRSEDLKSRRWAGGPVLPLLPHFYFYYQTVWWEKACVRGGQLISGLWLMVTTIYQWYQQVLYLTSRYLYPTSGYLIQHPGTYRGPIFHYLYPTSNIYIRRPIFISGVRYLYPTSDIYIRRPISISDV